VCLFTIDHFLNGHRPKLKTNGVAPWRTRERSHSALSLGHKLPSRKRRYCDRSAMTRSRSSNPFVPRKPSRQSIRADDEPDFVARLLRHHRSNILGSVGTRDQSNAQTTNALACVARRVQFFISSHSLRGLTDRYGCVAGITKLLRCHTEGRNVLA